MDMEGQSVFSNKTDSVLGTTPGFLLGSLVTEASETIMSLVST